MATSRAFSLVFPDRESGCNGFRTGSRDDGVEDAEGHLVAIGRDRIELGMASKRCRFWNAIGGDSLPPELCEKKLAGSLLDDFDV